jgi:hypothetical protein
VRLLSMRSRGSTSCVGRIRAPLAPLAPLAFGALGALGALVLCPGCFSFSYQRNLTFGPVAPAAVESLHPGESDLGEVLARLGAPIYVWEGKSGEVVLAYGAERERGWSFKVSVPLFERTSASLSYDDAVQKLEGFVLVFDSSLKLKILRAGLLRNLRAISARRPALVDESSQPAPQPAPQ